MMLEAGRGGVEVVHGFAVNAAIRAEQAERIQMTRFIACMLLVFYHVIGGNPDDGLRFAQGSNWHLLLDLFQPLRMPVFAFISGYLYARKPVSPGHERRFLAGKFRRLGFPLIIVSTLFYFTLGLSKGTPLGPLTGEWWRIYYFSYAIFWFLQAMLLIFVAMALFDRGNNLYRRSNLGLVICLLLLLNEFTRNYDFLSFSGAVFLAPYFIGGLACQRLGWTRIPPRGALAVAFFTAFAVHAVGLFVFDLSRLVGIMAQAVMGLAGPAWLLQSIRPVRGLVKIGDESFPIYLFHIFFIVAARMVGDRIGMPTAGAIALGVSAGLIGPMVAARILRLNPVARMALLGESTRGKARAPTEKARRASGAAAGGAFPFDGARREGDRQGLR